MDIHKPKPWHGVREFLKEYLIIVLGVLTALAGEQAIAWAHRGTEAREARAALNDEIATNATIAAYGVDEDKCFRRWIEVYAAWARDGGARPPDYSLNAIGLASSTWETVKTGAVTRMPLTERLALATLYDYVAAYQNVLGSERDASMTIHAIWARRDLDKETAGRLLEALKRADNHSYARTFTGEAIVSSAVGLGVKPKPRPPILVRALADTCAVPSAPATLDR